MRLRSSSTSAPKAATSSAVSGLPWDDVMDCLRRLIESEIEGDIRNRHRDAQADVLVGFGADLAGEQILHGAALLAARAAAADAHAASAPRPEPGALCLHQQRDAALATDVREGPRETQGDLGAVSDGHHARCERLGARELGIAALSPEGVRGLEQATRAAHQRAPFGSVRRDAVEVVARETSRQLARERRRARDAEMDLQVLMTLPEVHELAREAQVAVGVGVVRADDIRVDSAGEQVAQHRHEGGDAAAARDHEQRRRHRVGQHESAERLAQVDEAADRERPGEQAGEPRGQPGERRDARCGAGLRLRGHSVEPRRGCQCSGTDPRHRRAGCPWYLPSLRLRNHKLPLRTLRLRSTGVNMTKAAQAQPRPRLAASARRAQLVDVGRKVFAERGYEATSVEEIAERAGISKPIVYEHFGGKEGLYAVIVDREIEQIASCITEAISSGSPRERLERAALAFLTYVKERPGGFAVLLRDAPAAKSGGEMPALMHDLADRVGAIFTEQFRRAGYDARTAPIYAHALVGMVAFVGHWA